MAFMSKLFGKEGQNLQDEMEEAVDMPEMMEPAPEMEMQMAPEMEMQAAPQMEMPMMEEVPPQMEPMMEEVPQQMEPMMEESVISSSLPGFDTNAGMDEMDDVLEIPDSYSDNNAHVVDEGGMHILTRSKDKLTWGPGTLIYTKKTNEMTFKLDGTNILEYAPEKRGLLGSRDIAIWTIKRGPFDKKTYTLTTATYKKVVSLDFSKKEADKYLEFFEQIVADLGGGIVPFCPTQNVDPFVIDERNQLIKDDSNQFFRISDVYAISILENDAEVFGTNMQYGVPGAIAIDGASRPDMFPARGKADDIVTSLSLSVTLNDGMERVTRSYELLAKKSTRSGKEYRAALGAAIQLFTTLYNMIRY